MTDEPDHQMPAGVRPRRDPAATAPKITEEERAAVLAAAAEARARLPKRRWSPGPADE